MEEYYYLHTPKDLIKVRIQNLREVNDEIQDVREITDSFYIIDRLTREYYQQLLNHEVRIGNSEIMRIKHNSPADIIANINPAWIVVFLQILIHYDRINENTGRFGNYVRKHIAKISGLTRGEYNRLMMILKLLLTEKIDLLQDIAAEAGVKLEEIKQKLVGDLETPVKIHIEKRKKGRQ